MRVEIKQKGIEELAHDPRLSDQMLERAEKCSLTAARIAPVRYGTYKRSMFAAKLSRGTRPGAFYGSTDTKAGLMEYGSKNNRAFHTLRNAARIHHLRVVERRHR